MATAEPQTDNILDQFRETFGDRVSYSPDGESNAGAEGAATLEPWTHNSRAYPQQRFRRPTPLTEGQEAELECMLDGFDPVWSAPGYRVRLKVFASGDSELVALLQDERPRTGAGVDRTRKNKTRDQMSEGDRMRSAARAKKVVLESVMQMRADKLLTLTVRDDGSQTYEEFTEICRRFFALWRRRFGASRQYVCVFERHRKGNWHAHVSCAGWFDYNRMREMWHRAITGQKGLRRGHESPGNVNFREPHRGRVWRPASMARYLAKYVTKDFVEGVEFNRKRYWASKGIAPARTRVFFIPLTAVSPEVILAEMFVEIMGARPSRCRSFEIGWLRGVYLATF